MSGLIGSSPFVSRAEWGARAGRGVSTNITPQGNTAHYEGPHMGSYGHERCASVVRGIQAYHMDRNGWADIAYTSLVCQHGVIFEGRWFGRRTAANGTNTGNQISYAHCVIIGVDDQFPAEAMQALHDVFTYFEQHGSGARRWVHQDWFNTSCPGAPVMGFVRGGLIVNGSPPPPPPAPAPAPPAPPAPAPAPREDSDLVVNLPTISRGSNGTAVRNLQGLLMAAGRQVTIDGDFGPGTESALKNWQAAAGVPGGADGVCGTNSWRWLLGLH